MGSEAQGLIELVDGVEVDVAGQQEFQPLGPALADAYELSRPGS
jgi:hypothetical protein